MALKGRVGSSPASGTIRLHKLSSLMTQIFVFPGQGSQKVGMGTDLFKMFPDEIAAVDTKLGYSMERLCMEDPSQQLNQTSFTQPALYVVNALSYLKKIKDTGHPPDFLAGHSLGEYNALFAAGAFDLITGLSLVQKRGELMGRASGGGMAAIVGLSCDKVEETLRNSGLAAIDIANLNAPSQVVISGQKNDVEAAQAVFEKAGARLFILLKVSGAFHSRYMQDAKNEFEAFLSHFEFSSLKIPVISNVEAMPCETGRIRELLSKQITHPVRWTESIRYLLRQPEPEFEEIGPGKVLAGLIRQIKTA